MRLFFYLVFFMLAANLSYGAAVKKDTSKHQPAVLKTDTSAVTVRHFDKASLKAYHKLPEFQYKEDTPDTSWWVRFWRWFWQWIGSLFNFHFNKHPTAWHLFWQIVQLLLLLAGAAALVLFIFKSVGIDLLGAFRRKSTAAPIPYSEFFEDINQINFDHEIENAIAKHNYRFAVRLLYLKCLKQLSDSGLIKWEIDKTNSTYINELANRDQQEAFSILTYQFEHVWYGDFLIDGQVYKNISTAFQDFNKRVV